ncbi:MAG: SixA phosphatase family protein [Gammaproteobacteria bacterium]
MKYLALLRHAKSSWKNANLDDFDRPLNARGERDAPMMGRRLQARGVRPSLIVSSPAERARQTARLIAQAINYPPEFLQREAELYLASPATILSVIAQQEDNFNNLVVCGHNPGMTDLANHLTDSRIDNVPTCGIVGMEADIQRWADSADAEWRLVFFDYPKRIPEQTN